MLLWVAIPYASIATFIVGHIWRYRYDKFGWTTRSTQLYENRLLRLGSPLFHYGILLVVLGHIGGLLIPKSWTEAVGMSEHTYHLLAVSLGILAGAATLTGAAILIYRRRTVGPVFSATTRNDKIMYVLLIGTILLGLGTTVIGNLTDHPHDYRETVSPWFRSIFYLQPDPALMKAAPIGFQLHVLAAWTLFAFWPFSRLVHVFSMPLGYFTRPYIVYRSREAGRLGTRAAHRGWEQVR
ncbi:respiratory nitrate reductase subunit gamma [Nocardia sp. NPDC050793]|uniref:respiratory nitrate reductase subunit gamma n=1 Tax=Nocardia sp. NPDC050793 TaxID=3155159 RepID=UPI0033C5D30E